MDDSVTVLPAIRSLECLVDGGSFVTTGATVRFVVTVVAEGDFTTQFYGQGMVHPNPSGIHCKLKASFALFLHRVVDAFLPFQYPACLNSTSVPARPSWGFRGTRLHWRTLEATATAQRLLSSPDAPFQHQLASIHQYSTMVSYQCKPNLMHCLIFCQSFFP